MIDDGISAAHFLMREGDQRRGASLSGAPSVVAAKLGCVSVPRETANSITTPAKLSAMVGENRGATVIDDGVYLCSSLGCARRTSEERGSSLLGPKLCISPHLGVVGNRSGISIWEQIRIFTATAALTGTL